MRKETRESIFFREDYPSPDNKNWLKWIIVKKGRNGEMELSTEPIPFERYPLKPGVHQGTGTSL
jgi:succinate dehydrogenase/fumarate reductase flavoprotein subunit